MLIGSYAFGLSDENLHGKLIAMSLSAVGSAPVTRTTQGRVLHRSYGASGLYGARLLFFIARRP